MISGKEVEVFREYLRKKKLKSSEQREQILETFLEIEEHLTVEDLYSKVKKKNPSIGFATIYRTMKLLCDCGLCRELNMEDGRAKYEHLYKHGHHDHMICTGCGKMIEIIDPEIEALQEKIARKKGFIISRHRMQIYGICSMCRKNKK